MHPKPRPPVCPDHGAPTKRDACSQCNAAYMRGYLRRARQTRPHQAILERARKRARRQGLPFSLSAQDISLPTRCPVLGIPLRVGQSRSPGSPSLDRIDPNRGYVTGNVRVISDRANKLKGNRALSDMQSLCRRAPIHRRSDYEAVSAYMEREALLIQVRQRAARELGADRPWQVIACFLEQRFRQYGSEA